MIARMSRFLLVALLALTTACEVAAPILCGVTDVDVDEIPHTAECWRVAINRDDCVATARSVDACDAPSESDVLFAAGDRVTIWCDTWSTEAAFRRWTPVDCVTGESLAAR